MISRAAKIHDRERIAVSDRDAHAHDCIDVVGAGIDEVVLSRQVVALGLGSVGERNESVLELKLRDPRRLGAQRGCLFGGREIVGRRFGAALGLAHVAFDVIAVGIQGRLR